MEEPIILTPKEYYLWKRKSSIPFPWMRQFLNIDFIDYEKKRIEELSLWRRKFLKINQGEILNEEASFYVIPIKISSFWKTAIMEEGNFDYIGLSALQNSPQVISIALIPSTTKRPRDYQLIKISGVKKVNLYNKKENKIEPAIIIENWDKLESDKIYIDVPIEKDYLKKIFRESLAIEENIAKSLQLPFLSSPYVVGSSGGITLSSFSSLGNFSKELIRTMIRMLPPEYRNIPPPIGSYKGVRFSYINGIDLHFAERPYSENSIMTGLANSSYKRLYDELSNRNSFNGEYSIFSNINTSSETKTTQWIELMNRFTSTEITIPREFEEFAKFDFANLEKLKRSITSEMWSQMVHARYLLPSFNITEQNQLNKTILRLREDVNVHLSDVHKDESIRNNLIDSMFSKLSDNLKRTIKSIARSENKEQLDENHFSEARNLIIDNFTEYLSHRRVEDLKFFIEKGKQNRNYSILKITILNNPNSTAQEIAEFVKQYNFLDIYTIQKLLDWMQERGHVICNADKRYLWVL